MRSQFPNRRRSTIGARSRYGDRCGISAANAGRKRAGQDDEPESIRMTETLTATLTTTQGTVTVRLFPDYAPKTVRNFVELAEGGKEWTDPADPGPDQGQALRRHDFPPGDRRVHDPGRRPARHRHRRPWVQVRRRDPPRPAVRQAVPAGHGERGPGHQRLPVLHHGRGRRRGSTASTPSSARSSTAPTWWTRSAGCRPCPATARRPTWCSSRSPSSAASRRQPP